MHQGPDRGTARGRASALDEGGLRARDGMRAESCREEIWSVPQIKEDIVDGVSAVPQELVQFSGANCRCASAADSGRIGQVILPVPPERIQERIGEQISMVLQTRTVIQLVPLERIPERVVESISVAPQTTDKITEAIHPVPTERIHGRLVDLSSSVVPQITDKIVDGVRVVPHECVQNRTWKLFVDVPVPHIKEKIMDSVRVLP